MESKNKLQTLQNKKFAGKVRVHNKFVEAQTSLTLAEQRVLFYICAFQINEDDTKLKRPYTINVANFQRAFELKHKDMYNYLDILTDALMKRAIRIEYPHKKGFQKINWLSYCDYKAGEGKMEIEFNYKMEPYLLGLKSFFTQVGFLDFSGFRCKYSMWFLLLIVKWFKFVSKEFEIEDLKEKVGVDEGEYERFYNFKKFVIEVVEKELAEKSTLYFSWEISKKAGRQATHIKFYFHKKDQLPRSEKKLIASGLLVRLIDLGISEKTVRKLEKEEKEEFLEWVIPIIKDRKDKKRKKKEKIFEHEKYCLSIIKAQKDNFQAEYEEQKKQEKKLKKQREQAKMNKLDFINKHLESEYNRIIAEKALDKYKKMRADEQAKVIESFKEYMQSGERYVSPQILNYIEKEGIKNSLVRMEFRFYMSSRWQKENKYEISKLMQENKYEIEEMDDTYNLLQNGKKVAIKA